MSTQPPSASQNGPVGGHKARLGAIRQQQTQQHDVQAAMQANRQQSVDPVVPNKDEEAEDNTEDE